MPTNPRLDGKTVVCRRAEQLQAFEKEKRIISKQTRLIHERARQMSSKKDRIEIEALQVLALSCDTGS